MSLARDDLEHDLEHVAAVPSGFFAPSAQAGLRALVLGDKVEDHLAIQTEPRGREHQGLLVLM